MNALLVSDHNFPDGSAGAVREEILARMVMNAGYSVTHIGAGSITKDFPDYNGIKIYNLGSNKSGTLGRIENYLLFDKRIKDLFSRLTKTQTFDLIILTDLHIGVTKFFERYKKRNRNCILVYNVVEWYSKEHHKLGDFSLAYQNNNLTNRIVINRSFRVVSISRYLDDYFRSKGITSCRIPFVLDSKDFIPEFRENEKLMFSYIGRPSNNKDHLREMVEGFATLDDKELSNIQINIVGIDEDKLRENFGISRATIRKLQGILKVYGVLPRNEALKILKGSDFTILLRSDTQRYAKAGFPTKVCESMMYGIPVITNSTSDLGEIISDAKNGFIVDEDTSESFSIAVRKAILCTKEELKEMKYLARQSAVDLLDYKNYQNAFTELLR